MSCQFSTSFCLEAMKILPTTIIGSVAVLIAYWQWKTARQKVISDLFDRRMSLIVELEDISLQCLRDREVSGESANRFLNAESRARFLFGSEVIKRLDDINKCIVQMSIMTDEVMKRADPAEKVQQAKDFIESFSVLSNFLNNNTKIFAPYVAMTDKL